MAGKGKNTIKTTRGRDYNANNIAKIDSVLTSNGFSPRQRAMVLGTIIEESGGNPFAKSKNGTYQGIMQWGANRYRIVSNDAETELNNQIQYLVNTLRNTTDHVSWTHGGEGSGYNSFKDTYNTFYNTDAPLNERYRAFSYGYVRPRDKEDSYDNRLNVVNQVYDIISKPYKNDDYAPSFNYAVQPDATGVTRPPIVLPIHRNGYGGLIHTFGEGGYADDELSENTEAEMQAKAQYPFLNNLDFKVYSDPDYRASDYNDNGRSFGNIETFYNGTSRVKYSPDYTYSNPRGTGNAIVYNPDRISPSYAQDAINLDAVSHIGHDDATYDTLSALVGAEYPDAAASEMLPLYERQTGKKLMDIPADKRPYKKEWIPQVLEAWDDAPQRYQNAVDGLVRQYIANKDYPNSYKAMSYAPYNPSLDAGNNSPFYLEQLYDYVTTGQKPPNVLSEVIVTGNKHDKGGSLDTPIAWNNLSLSQKSQLMSLFLRNGIDNINTMRDIYNDNTARSFAEGGSKDDDITGYVGPEVTITAQYPYEQRVINTMNASSPEFFERLRNNDRRDIDNGDGTHSTHRLGSADNIVFPEIQDVNGQLVDYKNPPWQQQVQKAIENNDYIAFPTEGDARYFGEHYKKYFPEFFNGSNRANEINRVSNETNKEQNETTPTTREGENTENKAMNKRNTRTQDSFQSLMQHLRGW